MNKNQFHRCYGINFEKTIQGLTSAITKGELPSFFKIKIKEKELRKLAISNPIRFVEICDLFDSEIVYLSVEEINIEKTIERIASWQRSYKPITQFKLDKIKKLIEEGFETFKFTMADSGVPFFA